MTERIPHILERLDKGDERFAKIESILLRIEEKQDRAEQKQDRVNEIVEAWDNAKGFVATMKWLLKLAGVGAAIFGFLYAIYYFGKTGVWNPPKLP